MVTVECWEEKEFCHCRMKELLSRNILCAFMFCAFFGKMRIHDIDYGTALETVPWKYGDWGVTLSIHRGLTDFFINP